MFYEFCCSLFPLSAWESLRLCKLAKHHSIPVLYPFLIMLNLFRPTLIQRTCLSWKSDIFNQWLCLQHSSHCVWLEPRAVQWSVTSVWMGNVEPVSWKDRSWNCLLGHMIKSHSLLSANQTSCCLVGQTLNRFFFLPYTVGILPVWHVNCYKRWQSFDHLLTALKYYWTLVKMKYS